MATKQQLELKAAAQTEHDDLVDRLEDDFISDATGRYIAYLERRCARYDWLEKPGNTRIAKVSLFDNDMVAVFDQNGEQVPELQGSKEEVFKILMRFVDHETKFYGFDEK